MDIEKWIIQGIKLFTKKANREWYMRTHNSAIEVPPTIPNCSQNWTESLFHHYDKSQTLMNTLSQTPFPFILCFCLSILSVCLCFSLTLMCHTCPLSNLRLSRKHPRGCTIAIKSLWRAASLSPSVCEGVHICVFSEVSGKSWVSASLIKSNSSLRPSVFIFECSLTWLSVVMV